MVAQRKYDLAVILKQDNATRSITVIDLDDGFAGLCGSSREALQGVNFYSLLGDKTTDYLKDAVEFDADSPDLAEACARMRELRLRSATGPDVVRGYKIERIESPDGDGWFRLIVAGDETKALRDILGQSFREHFEGQARLADDTGLLSGEAAEAYLQMLKNVLPSREMDASCALLRIDRYDKSLARYGKAGSLQLLHHVANCCKSTFRAEDMVCQINDHTLAVFLIDMDHDVARVVFNRLRWNIRNHRIAFGGKEDFSVTVSIAFGSVLTPGVSMLERCKKRVLELSVDDRNQLIEIHD